MQRFDPANTGHNPNGTALKGDVGILAKLDAPVFPTEDYLLSDGTAYIHTDDNEIGAVDVETGEVQWMTETLNSLTIPELVNGDNLVARPIDEYGYVFDRASGSVVSEPTFGRGTGLGYDGQNRWFAPRSDGTLAAGEVGSDEPLWETPLGGIGLLPAVSNQRVYVATIHDTDFDELQYETPTEMDAEGRLYALDTADGSIVWEVSRERFGIEPPAVHDGTVYWTGTDGNLVAYDAGTGEQLWEFSTDRSFHTPPAVTDGTVLAGNDAGQLYALDSESGDEIGATQTDGRVRGGPVVVDDVVYFGSDDNTVYAVALDSGETLWEFKTGDSVRALSAGQNRVLVGTHSGMYVLGPRSELPAEDATSRETKSDGRGPAESDQQRGFLTNDADSSLAFLEDPVTLTWAGIGVSIAGIVIQLLGRQT